MAAPTAPRAIPWIVGSHDVTARTGGYGAGIDYRIWPGTTLGVALAGGFTNWGLASGLGGGDSDAFQAGLYGVTRNGPAYLAGALAFAEHWMTTDRFAYAGDHLTARFNAQSYGGRIEGGWRFATFLGGVAPYAAVQAQAFHTPAYNELDATLRRLRPELQCAQCERHAQRARARASITRCPSRARPCSRSTPAPPGRMTG